MKVLHTSDWHIGQRLYGKERHEEYTFFFDWLVVTIEQHNVQVLLVSGDVFDVAYPPNNALTLYYTTLLRIHKLGCQVIITGGNHDSVSTLHAPKELLAYIDVTVNATAPDTIADCIVEIKENNVVAAVVAAVPFLRDHEIRKAIPGQSHQEKQQALREGIKAYYQRVADYISENYPANCPVIGMAHLAMGGAVTSDSEREIHIGGLEQLSFSQLPTGFNYWALGHIHKPQRIAKQNHVRYCGSPIQLSFSERTNTNQVLLLNSDNKFQDPEVIPVPQYRKLLRFSGTFKTIQNNIAQQTIQPTDWLELHVKEENYLPTLNSELEELIEEVKKAKGCDILKYKITYAVTEINDQYTNKEQNLQEVTPKQVFSEYINAQGISEVEELENTFSELIDTLNQNN